MRLCSRVFAPRKAAISSLARSRLGANFEFFKSCTDPDGDGRFWVLTSQSAHSLLTRKQKRQLPRRASWRSNTTRKNSNPIHHARCLPQAERPMRIAGLQRP